MAEEGEIQQQQTGFCDLCDEWTDLYARENLQLCNECVKKMPCKCKNVVYRCRYGGGDCNNYPYCPEFHTKICLDCKHQQKLSSTKVFY